VTSVFDPPDPGSVQGALHAYAAYLDERDGAPDFDRRELAFRERDTARFETAAPCYDGAFDAALFERQLRRYDARAATSAEMQLVLCLVKINANEAYAVNRAIGRQIFAESLLGRIHRLVLLEEAYHTRVLRSSARLFGVSAADTSPPAGITRGLVSAITTLPDILGRPITLAAEAVGVATFLRAIGVVRRLFRDRPIVRDGLEERLTEVLVDEIGHVSFNRLIARPGTFAALRALIPTVALGTHGAMAEAEQLGIMPIPIREVLALDPQALPAEVRRRAFIA
jgi:hypothetical protein